MKGKNTLLGLGLIVGSLVIVGKVFFEKTFKDIDLRFEEEEF